MTTVLDDLRGRKFPVLDDGCYVSLVDAMGTDALIVRASEVAPPEQGRDITRHEALSEEVEKIEELYFSNNLGAFHSAQIVVYICWSNEIRGLEKFKKTGRFLTTYVQTGTKGPAAFGIPEGYYQSYWSFSLGEFVKSCLYPWHDFSRMCGQDGEIIRVIGEEIIQPLFPAVWQAFQKSKD